MNAVIQRIVQMLSAVIRRIPINRRIKGFFIKHSLLLRNRQFGFEFRCHRIGVNWSAAGFPDLMTRHMLFEGMYQEDVLIALRHVIQKGDIVYDVGGHHGLMAIVAAAAAGDSGRVVTFEPNPVARAHLERHIALNNITNITVENVALSDKEGDVPFFVQKGDITWNSTMVKAFAEPAPGAAIMVRTMTLDRYVSRSGLVPRVIKVDTEGSELMIMNGAKETLKTHRPFLIMELNPLAAEAADTTVSKYVSFLRGEAYNVITLKRSVLGYYKYEAQEPFDENRHVVRDNLVNVICIPMSAPQSRSDERSPTPAASPPPKQEVPAGG